MIVSIYGILTVYPVCLLIIWIFKKTKPKPTKEEIEDAKELAAVEEKLKEEEKLWTAKQGTSGKWDLIEFLTVECIALLGVWFWLIASSHRLTPIKQRGLNVVLTESSEGLWTFPIIQAFD